MAEWVLVPCLTSLRGEFNALAPGRDKASDGSIGDSAHASTSSDHNPDETASTPYEDADSRNEVHAIDVDRDLGAGLSMAAQVDIIVTRHRLGLDDRLQNVIYNRKIWSASWGWTAREYTGSNPHDKHAHFSARYTTAQENDTRPWGLLGEDDDDMDQPTFDARMDSWWERRMSPNQTVVPNEPLGLLRRAPWNLPVGPPNSGDQAYHWLSRASQAAQAVQLITALSQSFAAYVEAEGDRDQATDDALTALRAAVADVQAAIDEHDGEDVPPALSARQ